jgi:hypothetical protein
MGLAAYVDDSLGQALRAPVDFSLLASPSAVPGSIFSGATGIALYFVEMARLSGRDGGLLERARRWLDAVERWASDATIETWTGSARGFIFGEAGVAYVDALLGVAVGDASRATGAADRISRASARLDDVAEPATASGVVSGEAGIVLVARNLLARLPDADEYASARAKLRVTHDRALASLAARHARPLDPAPKTLLGQAHGVGGELFVLATSALGGDGFVWDRLAELAELRRLDANGRAYWTPRRGQDVDRMIGSWCNGVAGHTLLWCEVARRTRRPEAFQLAEQAARSTEFLMSALPSVCCGLAGQSIALQRFADLTGDTWFARRAYARLKRATEIADYGEHTWELWRGGLGVGVAALARMNGERAFPCIEAPEAD